MRSGIYFPGSSSSFTAIVFTFPSYSNEINSLQILKTTRLMLTVENPLVKLDQHLPSLSSYLIFTSGSVILNPHSSRISNMERSNSIKSTLLATVIASGIYKKTKKIHGDLIPGVQLQILYKRTFLVR